MKTNKLLLFAAAFAIVAACGKETVVTPEETVEDTTEPAKEETEPEAPEQPQNTVSFLASMEEESMPAVSSKAVMGTSNNLWEDGDEITIYSSGEGAEASGYLFSTSLESNSSSATFDYSNDDFVVGNYWALYPKSETTRAVNFTTYRMSQVSIPESQTLVAGSFDRKASVMMAYAAQGASSLQFKNAVALLKFRVSDSDIKGGLVVTSGAGEDCISGIFRADLTLENDVISDINMVKYNQPAYSNIEFSTGGASSLSTETDYYVAVRPTPSGSTLGSNLKVYLNGYLAKDIAPDQLSDSKIKRNKVYKLGELSKENASEIRLSFDFSNPDNCAGWATAKNNPSENAFEQTFGLYGTDYTFVLADPLNASINHPYYNSDASNPRLVIQRYRYVGLPAIAGYKLTGVEITKATSSTTTTFAICAERASGTTAPEAVPGGSAQTTTNETTSFSLTDTAVNTSYWLNVRNADIGVSNITLTYTK